MTKLVITFTDVDDYNNRLAKYDNAAQTHFGGNYNSKATKKQAEKKFEMEFTDMNEVMEYIRKVQ